MHEESGGRQICLALSSFASVQASLIIRMLSVSCEAPSSFPAAPAGRGMGCSGMPEGSTRNTGYSFSRPEAGLHGAPLYADWNRVMPSLFPVCR